MFNAKPTWGQTQYEIVIEFTKFTILRTIYHFARISSEFLSNQNTQVFINFCCLVCGGISDCEQFSMSNSNVSFQIPSFKRYFFLIYRKNRDFIEQLTPLCTGTQNSKAKRQLVHLFSVQNALTSLEFAQFFTVVGRPTGSGLTPTSPFQLVSLHLLSIQFVLAILLAGFMMMFKKKDDWHCRWPLFFSACIVTIF